MRVEFSLRASAVDLWEEVRQRISAATGSGVVPDRDVLLWAGVEFLATYLPLWLEEVERGDPVAVREEFRCAIPGCTVRGGSGHHIRFRSRGGSDDSWNLLFVCYTHHVEGIHRGHLRVSGRAPARVRVELGIRPEGTALQTFVNEERLVD